MITVLTQGLTGSETSACSGKLSIGRRKPAMAASTLEWPAATSASLRQAIPPRLVSTPTTLPPSTRMPVTSQFWMMSTPLASAPRA